MKNKLFIIGNGLDIAHNIPTRFNPDFKNIAEEYEHYNFWSIYQSEEDDIWSDFENLLGYPNIDTLGEIFNGYEPDYLSDRESDRTSIIFQVDLNGNLQEALNKFANNAEETMMNTKRITSFDELLDSEGYYITFNYTHTLEYLYKIPSEQILHIHGEVGKNNLKLGYPKGNFKPEKYSYDVRAKGRGDSIEIEVEDYISEIEDYYVRTSYENLIHKCKSFYKDIEINLLKEFLEKNKCEIKYIIVYGHSCAIDFDYFKQLSIMYLNAHWYFYVKGRNQEENVKNIVKNYDIRKVDIIKI